MEPPLNFSRPMHHYLGPTKQRKNMRNTKESIKLAPETFQASTRTPVRMVQQKQVPDFKVGGQWRIRESQFKKWVERKENGFSG